MKNKKLQISISAGKIITFTLSQLILIILAIMSLFPFIWMLASSLKTNAEMFQFPPKIFPEIPQWSNYPKVFESVNFGQAFLNSVKLAVINTFGQVLTSAMAGYALGKLKFKGSNLLFSGFIGVMMVPYTVIVIPIFAMFSKMGLIDSHLGIILMTFAYMPMGVFLCRQFIMSLPNELFDAAIIDGASYLRIFFTVVIPLIKPAIASLAVFSFLWNWNSYFTPMIFLTSPDKFTVPLTLQMFKGKHSADWSLIMAASTISVLPVLIVYMFGQNYIVEGITITGMKS
ncbi:MAG: carbohydrate ABC transporter permease [Erysipelotrichaceae bacterium]|nr:carbohydrate ABC transporter permease [Erysipelotrichaceae bacterium]